jgi:UDP-GlcNAc:undecaprenyl-phosphate GlcNAc-1-phosphate transferase
MRTYLVAFVLSLVVGLILTRVLRDLAHRFDLVDLGGGRKIHKRPIPRLGGIAVGISGLLPLLGLAFWRNDISAQFWADIPLLVSLSVGGGLMFFVGLYDDLKDARARVKLAAQILAACVVFASGIRIEAVSIPFFHPIALEYFSLPATIFWMVLVMNAVNLIDGMDGLAGGVVVLAGATLFVMSVIEGNDLAALLLAVTVGSTMGFLAYNVNPASIFLGDTGSLLLGFVLALLSVHSSQKSYTLFSIVAAMMALGLPIFDLGMAVVRRFLSGQPIFSPDQHHVHHILLRRGFSQSQAALVLFGGAIVLEGLALVFIYADDALSAVAIAAVVPLLLVAVRALGYAKIIRNARRALALEGVESAANAQIRALQDLKLRLPQVVGPGALVGCLGEAAEVLGLQRLELELGRPHSELVVWSRPGGHRSDVHIEGAFVRELPLLAGDQAIGRLRIWGHAEGAVFGPLSEALLLLLAETLTAHFAVAPSESRLSPEVRPSIPVVHD